MVGSIDPGARQSVGPIGRTQVAWLFGARVAETILASGSNKPHQQAGHMDASDPIRPQKPLVPRGPSTYGSRLSPGRLADEFERKDARPGMT
jgi:hypothetical protein